MVAKLASFNDLATKALHVLVGFLPLNVFPRFTRLALFLPGSPHSSLLLNNLPHQIFCLCGRLSTCTRWSIGRSLLLLYAFTPAPSPTRAVARSTRRKFYYSLRLLLVPTTLVREIIILFGIYMSFSTPSIYLYKALQKNTFCIYTRPQIVIETKVNDISSN